MYVSLVSSRDSAPDDRRESKNDSDSGKTHARAREIAHNSQQVEERHPGSCGLLPKGSKMSHLDLHGNSRIGCREVIERLERKLTSRPRVPPKRPEAMGEETGKRTRSKQREGGQHRDHLVRKCSHRLRDM